MRDHVVLVTGGTGALGAAVALGALEAGATTVVTYRDARDRDALAQRAPLPARERLHGVQADVTDGESVRRLVDEVTARHRRLDTLVNAVGAFAAGDLLATDERAWDAMLTVNLRSAYLCCRAALPAMLTAGRGRIVNVASRSVVPPAGGFLAYTVAKAGVIALTQALAQEVRGRGSPSTPSCPARWTPTRTGAPCRPRTGAAGSRRSRWRGRSCSWRATPPRT